jgi:hypothetical protein
MTDVFKNAIMGKGEGGILGVFKEGATVFFERMNRKILDKAFQPFEKMVDEGLDDVFKGFTGIDLGGTGGKIDGTTKNKRLFVEDQHGEGQSSAESGLSKLAQAGLAAMMAKGATGGFNTLRSYGDGGVFDKATQIPKGMNASFGGGGGKVIEGWTPGGSITRNPTALGSIVAGAGGTKNLPDMGGYNAGTDGEGFFGQLGTTLSKGWTNLSTTLSTGWTNLSGFLGTAWDDFGSILSKGWDGLSDIFSNIFGAGGLDIGGMASGLMGGIGKMATGAMTWLGGFFKDGGLVNPAFANGGYVSGPGSSTSDSIQARLSNGEYVINAASTRKYQSLLKAINEGTLDSQLNNPLPPAFAEGGQVGGIPTAVGSTPVANGGSGMANPTYNTTHINISGNVDQRSIDQIRQVISTSPKQVNSSSKTGERARSGLRPTRRR